MCENNSLFCGSRGGGKSTLIKKEIKKIIKEKSYKNPIWLIKLLDKENKFLSRKENFLFNAAIKKAIEKSNWKIVIVIGRGTGNKSADPFSKYLRKIDFLVDHGLRAKIAITEDGLCFLKFENESMIIFKHTDDINDK